MNGRFEGRRLYDMVPTATVTGMRRVPAIAIENAHTLKLTKVYNQHAAPHVMNVVDARPRNHTRAVKPRRAPGTNKYSGMRRRVPSIGTGG